MSYQGVRGAQGDGPNWQAYLDARRSIDLDLEYG